jgi:gliding motility-associated-like protein
MSTATRFLPAFCCSLFFFANSISAQNLALSTQNPAGLYVCGVETVTVTIQNAGGSPVATTLSLGAVFPNGITYMPGSVSGATEFNISNLGSPVFTLANLPGGASATVTFSVTAGCALVDAINAGQQFSNSFTATYTGGSKQLTSNSYIVETGLANIISVTPTTITGMKGDVIMRTIKLKNTRQGPIQSLKYRDQHQAGISIELVGAVNQVDNATLFSADVPGGFFNAFGDGDNLLEFGDGEITLVEKVTITDCGVPSYTVTSDIIIGWGCGANTCRNDSIQAFITILPSNQNPNLSFEPIYNRPLSNCGQVGTEQEIRITNNGQLPAQNVLIDLFTLDTTYMGFDINSFEWSIDGVNWQPATIAGSVPTTLTSCGLNQYKLEVIATVPLVPAGTTVRLRFKSYFCQPTCLGLYPRMRFGFHYNKACPANVSTTGLLNYYPDTNFLNVTSRINFDIGHCLEDDSTYQLVYYVKSQRLLVDTGVLKVLIQLPFGFDWDPSCGLNLGGQTPLSFSTNIETNGSTTIQAVFDLPFAQDSVGDEICIKYHCEAGLPCEASVPNVPPRGLDFTVYPPPADCKGCELKIRTFSTIALDASVTPECGITACDEFTIVVDDSCNGGGGGGGGLGDGSGDLLISVDFDSWRANRDFEDNNNDRKADSANKANAPGIRLDRFITGDTMRNELQVTVLTGTLYALNYRLFTESLMSDFTKLGGDGYDLLEAKKLFVNYDTTEFAGGRVIIKKAGGQVFSCPIEKPLIRSDQHIINVAQPNIRPPAIVDQVASMFDQYTFSVSEQIALGCLPQGFTLTAGDSIFLQADYKFTHNFTPAGAATPPLVNFKTSVCDRFKNYSWELENFCTEKPIRQFSGYLEEINPAAQRIEPCAVSTEINPFSYKIRIARENMFPFEVRPLSTIFGYSYSLPTAVNLLETKLNYLRLQENVPLFSNQTLTPFYGGDSIQLDLSGYFSSPMDEGYSFEISTKFDTTCGYDGTKFGRTNLSVRYANECLHKPQSVNYFIANPNGYQNGSPVIDFFNIGANINNIPTNDVVLNFTLRNNSPVPALNAWLVIESGNNLNDLELFYVNPPNLVPVTKIGDVYQLGDLGPFDQPFFRIKAKSVSCANFTVNYRFGWGCNPTFNDQSKTCGEFSGTIEIRPQPPELELVIIKQPPSIPLCAPSTDFEFEIANANDGSAYNVVPTIKLPAGIRVEPGSSRLSFPAGVGALVPMPDPVQLPGNVWQFDPQVVSPLLAQNGLVSFDQEPLNAMRILFKVRADCGAVANSQPVYGAEAVQPCGISSNKLRKPGQPILIDGVNPVNGAVSNLNFANPPAVTGCGQTVVLNASILLEGTPSPGDSIFITLPAGTSYVAGSYSPGVNAPAGPPKVSGLNLQLPLPSNLGTNTVLNFSFSIRYDSPAGCADKFVTLQTREKTQAICGNTPCPVYIATSEALLNLNAQNPELQLNNFQLQTPSGGQTTFSANLENAGTDIATNPVVQLYHDVNGNGIIDPTDPLVATVNHNGSISPGASTGISGNLNLPPSAYCDLIALIPAAENCACADKVFPLGGNQVVTQGIGLCDLQTVAVGTDSIPGNSYTWQTPDGLSCTTCAHASYTPGPGISQGDLVTLVLIEKSGDCSIERRFDIQFGGNFGLESTEQTICNGQSATLQGTPGGISYNWTGPGITNPNQQNQTVTPSVTGLYQVTVTFAGGCTGTGTTTVVVNPAASTNLEMMTCSGLPIPVFSDLNTDVPGVYTRKYTAFNGCDSVVTVTLKVPPVQTEETKFICQGDSIVVFGETFKTEGMKCANLPSTTGCDSTHCVTIKVRANPVIPVQDSVVVQAGTQITLNGPSGFAAYSWSPPGSHLSCINCQNPVATPDSTTTFVLVVTDADGCQGMVSYRVVTCDIDKFINEIPNAFTPNGDGANDSFSPIDREGAEMLVSLEVYNRWGQKVYEGFGKDAAWDGRVKGEAASSDVYVYILVAECNGLVRKKHGEINLLR